MEHLDRQLEYAQKLGRLLQPDAALSGELEGAYVEIAHIKPSADTRRAIYKLHVDVQAIGYWFMATASELDLYHDDNLNLRLAVIKTDSEDFIVDPNNTDEKDAIDAIQDCAMKAIGNILENYS